MISLSRLHLTASPWVLDLLTHLWQSTMVALAILGLLSFCGALSARTRRLLGWIAVAKFALPAAWVIALIERVGGTPKPWLASEAWLLPAATLPVARSAPVAAPDFPIGQILGAIWAVGAVGLLAWWMVRAMRARTRILETAVEAPAALAAQVAHAAARAGLRQAPRCVIVEGDHGPGLVGIVSPTLVLPRGLAEALAPAELEAILIHENVHVRRRDNLWNAVRGGFVGLLWFNPVAWLLNRTLSLEMEKSCDERVLEITRDADTYARSIVASVRHTLGLVQPGLAGATTPPVVGRIKAIFAYPARRDRAMVRWTVLLAGVGLVALSGRAGSITADTPVAVANAAIAATAAPEQPASPAATSAKPEPTLSIDFPDQNIRDILRNVADLFQLNVIMPETLQGKTTIKLRDVAWRQIFTAVLEPVGHAFVERDNMVVIVKNERKATGYKIGTLAIQFAGVASVSEQAVRAVMQLRDGGEFDERSLDRDVRAIYALGVFKSVEVKHETVGGSTVNLVFELTPKPVTGAPGASGTLTFTPSNAPAAGAASFPNLNPNGGTLSLSGGANANSGVTFDVPAQIPSAGTAQVSPRTVQEELTDAQQKLAEANAELQRMRDERAAVLAKQQADADAQARARARDPAPAPAAKPVTISADRYFERLPRPDFTSRADDPSAPSQSPVTYGNLPVYELRTLDRVPIPKFQARPFYPFEMRKAGIGGEVVVDFIVTDQGDVANATATRSTRSEFERAAVTAVSKWKFRAGQKAGKSVHAHMQVPIVFTLDER